MSEEKCKRCKINPTKPNAVSGKPSKFCGTCQMRNLMDGLDLPTHPEMLDKFSKHPTLSERHFQKALSEVDCEE